MNAPTCIACRTRINGFHDVSVCLAELRAMEMCMGADEPQDASGAMRAVVRGAMIVKARIDHAE